MLRCGFDRNNDREARSLACGRIACWMLGVVVTAGSLVLPSTAAAQVDPPRPLELSYVPKQASVVMGLAAPAIHEPIRQALKAAQAAEDTEEKLAKLIQANLLAVLGAPSEAIEQITVVMMRPYIMRPASPLPGQNGLIIRTRRPHDFKRVASFFPASAVEKTHAGRVYYVSADARARCYYFPDERTALVVNRESDVPLFIDAGKAGATQASWAQTWKNVQGSHFAFLVDLAAMRQESPPPVVASLGPLGQKATTLVLGGSFNPGLTLVASATCATPEDSNTVKEAVEALLAQGRKAIPAGRQTVVTDEKLPAEAKRLVGVALDIGESLLKNAQIQREQATVHVKARVTADAAVAFGSAWVLPALTQVRRAAP